MRPRRISIASDEMAHDPNDLHTSGDDSRSHRRRPLGLRHPVAVLVGALLAGYALFAATLHLLVDTDALRDWLTPKASAVLNRPVSVGSARVALLPRPSIHVADLRIDNLEGFDGPALAFADRARLDMAWLQLLVGRVRVHRVHLDGPRVNLVVEEDGRSNFGDLIPAQAGLSDGPAAPVRLGIDRVEISRASLSYFDARSARSFVVSGGTVRVSLAPEGPAGWRADVTAKSDSLQVRVAGLTEEVLRVEGPSARLTAHGDGTGSSVDIDEGSVEVAGEMLALRGRLAGLSGPRPSYDLQLSNHAMDAAALTMVVPARTRSELLPHVDGELGVTFQVTGAHATGERPLIRGAVSLDGVSIRLGGDVVVDRLHGSIGVSPDTLALDSLTGVFADGPFELSGSVARQDRTLALMARARPDLDALDRLGLVQDGTTLSGDATLVLSVAGSLDAPDSVEVAGVVTVTGLQAKHTRFGVPLYVPEGELELSGHEIRWSELEALVGRDAVVTSGSVSDLVTLPGREDVVPRFEVSVRAPRLDLSAVLPAHAGAPDVTYAQVAFAHLGGRSIEGQPAAAVLSDLGLSRPTSLPARGALTVELDTLDFRGYHIEGLSARVEMSDSSLAVDAPSFRVWGGDAETVVRVGVGQQREAPFSLRLSIEGADAHEFLTATTPIAGVSGTLTLDLEAAGALDATLLPVGRGLTGRADISIVDGRIQDTGPNLVVADFLGSEEWTDLPFDTWVTSVDFVDRRVEIRESKLNGAEAFVALDGMVHLDGSHDLSLGLSIPPGRLQTVSLRRTGIGQSVLDHLSAAGSSLDLGLRMSGVLRAPVLEPDASNAVAPGR